MSATLSRRGLLRLGGLAVGGLALAGCGASLGARGQTAELVRSTAPIPEAFRVRLPIPPVRRPVGGRLELVARAAELEILPGLRTPVIGYDGLVPGPTVETRRGEPVVITHRNESPVPTVVHLHGGHTTPADDGVPIDLVIPAGDDPMRWLHGHAAGGDVRVGAREYRYPMDQRAATLWYHDHRMDFTGPQVYRGLAGLHLVRDDEEDALGLPGGERELPLMITDKSFDADGSLRYPSLDRTLRTVPGVESQWSEGVLGDVMLVNGAPWPVVEVDAARYRLRVLNACNARRLQLALEPGGDLVQIGSDHGLLAAPIVHATLPIAPAERFDLVVDFARYPVGSTVVLANRLGDGAMRQVMAFRVVRGARDDSRVPERLCTIETLGPPTATHEFTFTRGSGSGHGSWVIDGLPYDPNRVDVRPRLGEVQRWRFTGDLHHPVHVHLDPFQVVSRSGGDPLPSDAGWKDTVDVRPGEVVDVDVRFTRHTGRYLIHCHNLEHEDMAMMAVFETVSGE